VEDDDASVGKDAGIRSALGLLLDSEVGEEQMVVDDYDVAFGSAAAHLCDEAFVPGTTLLAEAGICASIELVPERAGFWKCGQFGEVSTCRSLFPSDDSAVLLDL